MIKYFIIALSLLLFSCIDIITEEEFYEDICDPKIKGVKHSLAYAKFDDS